MKDLIDRQAAIEHLKKRLIETAINNVGVISRCDSIFEDTADNRIGPWINELPSAQPCTDEEIQKMQDIEQAQFDKIRELAYQDGKADAMRWIPCSKRLPFDAGYYLTTTIYNEVFCDYWNLNEWNRTEQVIAWMPLPEPYSEDDK